MKQRILAATLVLCLCISSQSVAYAWQEPLLMQGDVLVEESISGMVTRDGAIPTPTEVYEAMTALKEQDGYREGTPWTNDEPYSDSKGYYHWKGGPLGGANISAVGCVAFAFILSDAAFGSLPARMYAEGEFTYEDIKIGDILRVSNDVHTVIVLEVTDAGVVVAEGNISTGDHIGKVHWGRTISKEEVMGNTSHYITRYPEGYISPDDPTANDIIGSGTLEGGLTWSLTKAGTLTISGKGAMPDFSSTGDQPWNDNSSKIRKVVIGDGVTSIGSCAFWNCGVLSAEISPGVTTIGNSAFRSSSVISVTIPSSVKTIGDSAFRECENLSSVTVSEGVEKIDQNAFRACKSLTSIALPASIGEVGAAAFFQCQALKSATFAAGNKQVKLGDNMFTQCYYLMSVKLPQNIDCIGEGMFQNCLMLAGVEIPQGAESIGMSAFASCSGLTTVIIPDSVTTIGIAAFASCPLTDIYFTGSEAQWNSISKMGDTASAVSKAKIHYNFTPPAVPDPDPDGDNNNGDEPGSGDKPGSGDTPGNGDKPGNGDNPGIGDKPGSEDKPGEGDKPGSEDKPGEGDKPGSGNNPGMGDNLGSGDNPGSVNNPGGGDNSGSGESQAPITRGKTFTISKVTYKVTKVGKEVELTKSKSTATKVTINTVTGTDGVKYKVTFIGPKAMQNNKKMTNLTIGANVKTIGKGAFNGCKKLGKVKIQSTKLRSIGKQAFKGTKSNLKVKVPSKQLEKYKKILKKAGLKVKQVTK